jgi:putative nucleotidyltransferase with HDIG domain
MDRFWNHAFFCGLAAVIMGRDLRVDTDSAFMAGLIHDIGKLVMLQTFADDYTLEHWMTAYSDQTVLQTELQTYSFTHDAVGGQLLEKWQFPANLVTAVAYHHRPDQAAAEPGYACLVQLADLFSYHCCREDSPELLDIVATARAALPDLAGQWQKIGWPLADERIAGWYHSLLAQRTEGIFLKDAFSGLPM